MEIDLKTGEQFPYDFIIHNRLLKIYQDAEKIIVARDDSASRETMNEVVHFNAHCQVVFKNIDKKELDALIRDLYKGNDKLHFAKTKDDDSTDLAKLASDAPVVNLVNEILLSALDKKVSDVHFEAYDTYFRVRFRINGTLVLAGTYPKNIYDAVCARIKIMSKLDITNKRYSQDGKATLSLYDKKIDIRTSSMPTIFGESIVLRFLGIEAHLDDLTCLGFTEYDIAACTRIIQKSFGAFILTGPTGSGKTTTLRALIRMLDYNGKNVITVEDPVEYTIEGINQVQINDKINFGFSSILRNILRQDPDVIMVGEMRDEETADLALRSAMTGHLVLSTLHTNDAVSSISRLLNMGVQPYVIESSIIGCAAQRLVRTLCPHCKKKTHLEKADAQLYKKYAIEMDECYVPVGCEHCNHTGFQGRSAVFELFELDEQMRAMIIDGGSIATIRHYLKSIGYTTMFAKGLAKAAAGMVALEEVKSIVGEIL